MDPVLLVRCDPEETFGVAPSALGAAGVPIAVWEALDGEPRPPLDRMSGVVLFGSSHNIEHSDDQPFIKEACELTLDAIDRSLPYLGICFGAQLLAWSLDAPVLKAPVREIGYEPIRPTREAATDPLVGHYADGDRVFQWHMDTYELPVGATLIAAGDLVHNQAFRVGERAWGIQWHLDVDRPEVDLWLGSFEQDPGHDLQSMWGKTADAVRAEADRLHPLHEWKGRETFARFALLAASTR
ncbi:MAG: type 1 glutamine amidotransferase [Actinomycetota bacterium]|nr:type 1 glutamine amidotransferase [Actinomycetota bacterium]MDH5313459.1 type 1 glutamine amidotransferase [Actinomycetota bacterium]